MTLEEMAAAYHAQLLEHDDAVAYYDELGVSEQVIERMQLGWIAEPLTSNHKHMESTPVVPYVAAQGRVMALRAAPFVSDQVEHHDQVFIESRWPSNDLLHLFNVGNSLPGLRTDEVHLVDSVAAVLRHRSDGRRAVGVPGWQNFQPEWSELFLHSKVRIHHESTVSDALADVLDLFRRRRITYTEVTP